MGKVHIVVNNRGYDVACDDGQGNVDTRPVVPAQRRERRSARDDRVAQEVSRRVQPSAREHLGATVELTSDLPPLLQRATFCESDVVLRQSMRGVEEAAIRSDVCRALVPPKSRLVGDTPCVQLRCLACQDSAPRMGRRFLSPLVFP